MEPIGRGASGADVVWLRQRLGALDREPISARRPARMYDESLAARVAAFQRAQGLHEDGVAGEETLAKLTAVLDAAAPSLRRARSGS